MKEVMPSIFTGIEILFLPQTIVFLKKKINNINRFDMNHTRKYLFQLKETLSVKSK